MLKSLRRLTIVLTAAGVAAAILLPSAHAAEGGLENQFVNKINASRRANGLGNLEVHWDLQDDARAHSARMKNQGKLYHNPNLGGVTSGWDALGENVGVGPFVDALHQAFMSSAGHRKNILGNYTHVGVGVVREGDSKLWVTAIFMRASGSSSAPATTTTTTTQPPQTTTTTAPPPPPPDPEPVPAPAPPPPAAEPAPAPAPAPSAVKASQPKPKPKPQPEPEPVVPILVRLPGQICLAAFPAADQPAVELCAM